MQNLQEVFYIKKLNQLSFNEKQFYINRYCNREIEKAKQNNNLEMVSKLEEMKRQAVQTLFNKQCDELYLKSLDKIIRKEMLMKNNYKTEGFVLYKHIDMSNWCKKRTILKLLESNGYKMHERIFRGLVAYNNVLFNEGKRDMYIAHSNEHGYIATTDETIIRASIADLKSRAFDMLEKSNSTEKRLNELKMKKEYDQLL